MMSIRYNLQDSWSLMEKLCPESSKIEDNHKKGRVVGDGEELK